MNDGPASSQTALNVLFGVVMALGAFILRLYKNKVDSLEAKTNSFVPREEMTRMFDQMREDRRQQHTENIGRSDQLREDIRALHGRIDQVLSK